MSSRKRPHVETIESVAYKSFERKAWDMLMVNSLVVIILNNLLLPITEVVRVGASQRTISTSVLRITLNFNKNRVLLIKF